MRRTRLVALLALVATPAVGGPPYATDDPDPTETGGIEAYLFTDGEWVHGYSGDAGIEANYGAAKDIQLSLGLPLAVSTNPLHVERGNVDLSAKWRFFNDEESGWSAAIFPGIALPTAKGSRGVGMLLPVWGGWRGEKVAVFGGGGRAVTTVPGGRDHWVAGLAATRDFGGINLGIEVTHEGTADVGGHGVNGLGIGAIVPLGGSFALVARGGPAFEEGTGRTTVRTFFGIQGLFGPK